MKFTIRSATRVERDTIQELIAISARELSRTHYSDEQIAAALAHVFGVDSALIADGTYFVAEANGKLVGCGGWSKRKTLFGGDQFASRDAGLLDPKTDAGKIARSLFIAITPAKESRAPFWIGAKPKRPAAVS